MLRLSRPLLDQIVDHVRAVYPEEGCGLISGQGDEAQRVYTVENILHSPTAYEMDPYQQITAMLAIEAAEEALQATFHSHPVGPAEPSPTDIRLATYPESLTLIISLERRDVPRVRGFQIVDGVVTEALLIFE